MSAIVQILTGELPAHVKDAKRKKYHRDHWHAHPEYKTANAARKRERYATDEEYREQRKQQEQQRRSAHILFLHFETCSFSLRAALKNNAIKYPKENPAEAGL